MVGEAARLTARLAALVALFAGTAFAQAAEWVVEGGCRDGQPHGRYELRNARGALRATGAFNHGKRTSSFIFWTDEGVRIAHIPYDEDARNGTLASWYDTRRANADAARRFESSFRHGLRDGLTRSWYRNGHRRSEAEYDNGRLVGTAAWSDAGTPLDDRAAREVAHRDAAGADADYARLEALVRQHLPGCP
jgi:hypothetical protein